MSAAARPSVLPNRRQMKIREVAELLGVDVRHIRRLVHEKRIPYIKWGHLLRFDPVEIAAWIDSCRFPPQGAVSTPRFGSAV